MGSNSTKGGNRRDLLPLAISQTGVIVLLWSLATSVVRKTKSWELKKEKRRVELLRDMRLASQEVRGSFGLKRKLVSWKGTVRLPTMNLQKTTQGGIAYFLPSS